MSIKSNELDKAEETLKFLLEQKKEYISNSKAKNTVKSYSSDWQHFTQWCKHNQLGYLPTNDENYSLYLSSLAIEGYRVSTIRRRMSSIAQAHLVAGHPSPTTAHIKVVWAGIRRVHGASEIGKLPVVIDILKLMLNELPDKLQGIRDRAVLLIGFAGAFRRSELVSLDIEFVSIVREGLIIQLNKSKTDQEGKGESIGIPYGSFEETCPVRAYIDWIQAANLKSGPVFRSINRHNQVSQSRLSDKSVALIVKRYVNEAGLDEKLYAGHSLRAGLATTAAMLGKSERAIMDQTRHRSEAMVRKYIRMGSIFKENAASNIGL
ncbi:integrase [Paenibacillus terrae]|uniref:Integrase n=1 Tax=Paenibacillus terrae TaxID=159743 RepID=A0A0D7WU10_9BACL|nr:integrase [Paenibacillus terrae]